MKTPENQGPESKKRLHELEEAIDRLQERLEAIGRSLKEIKNALDRPDEDVDAPQSRNDCIALPYLFIS